MNSSSMMMSISTSLRDENIKLVEPLPSDIVVARAEWRLGENDVLQAGDVLEEFGENVGELFIIVGGDVMAINSQRRLLEHRGHL